MHFFYKIYKPVCFNTVYKVMARHKVNHLIACCNHYHHASIANYGWVGSVHSVQSMCTVVYIYAPLLFTHSLKPRRESSPDVFIGSPAVNPNRAYSINNGITKINTEVTRGEFLATRLQRVHLIVYVFSNIP